MVLTAGAVMKAFSQRGNAAPLIKVRVDKFFLAFSRFQMIISIIGNEPALGIPPAASEKIIGKEQDMYADDERRRLYCHLAEIHHGGEGAGQGNKANPSVKACAKRRRLHKRCRHTDILAAARFAKLLDSSNSLMVSTQPCAFIVAWRVQQPPRLAPQPQTTRKPHEQQPIPRLD